MTGRGGRARYCVPASYCVVCVSVLSVGARDGGGGSVGPGHIWCSGYGGLGVAVGVCWSWLWIVAIFGGLWGSRVACSHFHGGVKGWRFGRVGTFSLMFIVFAFLLLYCFYFFILFYFFPLLFSSHALVAHVSSCAQNCASVSVWSWHRLRVCSVCRVDLPDTVWGWADG